MSVNPATRRILDPLIKSLRAVEVANRGYEQIDPGAFQKELVKMNLLGEQGNQYVFDDAATKQQFCAFAERIADELDLGGATEWGYQLRRLLPDDALDELNLDGIRHWLEQRSSQCESESCNEPTPTATNTSDDVTHSPDFRSVRWNGQLYSFTANQAPVVRVLYDSFQRGAPEVGDETLLFAVDPEVPPVRLDHLFRNNSAWGTVIIAGVTRGTHRLAEPPQENS